MFGFYVISAVLVIIAIVILIIDQHIKSLSLCILNAISLLHFGGYSEFTLLILKTLIPLHSVIAPFQDDLKGGSTYFWPVKNTDQNMIGFWNSQAKNHMILHVNHFLKYICILNSSCFSNTLESNLEEPTVISKLFVCVHISLYP